MGALDDNREVAILLIYVCVPVSTLAVALRTYSRISIVRNFGLDDKFAVLSCLCNIIVATLVIVILGTGGGKPVVELSLAEFGKVLKMMWILWPLTEVKVCFVQLSYLAFYRRFLVDRASQVLLFVTGFVILQHVFFTFLVLFRCHPVSNVWDPLKFRDGCLDWPKMILSHAVVNIICDFTIYSLPLPSVLQLRVGWRRKLSLLSLFLIGFIVLAASVWRLHTVIIFNIDSVKQSAFSSINAATIEYNLAILIACIPGMKPLFMKAFNIHSSPGTFRMPLNTINNIESRHDQPRAMQVGSVTSTMYTYSAHIATRSDVAIINRGVGGDVIHSGQHGMSGPGDGSGNGRRGDVESGVLEESENESDQVQIRSEQAQAHVRDVERQANRLSVPHC